MQTNASLTTDPGCVSPVKRAPSRGILLGRHLLKADGYSRDTAKFIEQVIITSSSPDAFVQEVVRDIRGMNEEKALLVWDLYKLV